MKETKRTMYCFIKIINYNLQNHTTKKEILPTESLDFMKRNHINLPSDQYEIKRSVAVDVMKELNEHNLPSQ